MKNKVGDVLATHEPTPSDRSLLGMPLFQVHGLMAGMRSLEDNGVFCLFCAASHVFLLEPSVSVPVEQQAIARVHRFGQKKPILITRFISQNTVEVSSSLSFLLLLKS